MKLKALSMAVLTATSCNLLAATAADETIVVTANRMALSTDDVLASQITISREQIEITQPESIPELLAGLAGFDVNNNGGRGQTASVLLRGSNSGHTLVLVDGVRVGSASLGSTNLNAISPDMVERIEIIKGPRAAIWGSDAIGGVIHIFTRKLDSDQGVVSASYGSDNTGKLSASLGFTHGDGSTSISISKERSDGFDVLATAEEDDDGYDATSIAIQGSLQTTEQLSLAWGLTALDNDTDYDNAFGGANQSEQDNHQWHFSAEYDWSTNQLANSTKVTLGQSRDKSNNFGNGLAVEQGDLFETRRNQLSVLQHIATHSGLRVNLGGDLYKETLNAKTEYAEDERLIKAVFAQGHYHADNVTAELAIRYDDVEGIGSESTYNASLAYQINDSVELAILRGTGFKAPTFNDLYFPASPYSSGNSELQAETSDTTEIALNASLGEVLLTANAYQSDIDNLIEWRPDANFFYKPENVASAELKGVELGLSFNAFGGEHEVQYSYLDAKNAETGERLTRRARNKTSYNFNKSFGLWDVNAQYIHVGERKDATFAGPEELDSYQLFNASVFYRVSEQLKFGLKVQNLFDEEYQTVVNYNTQGRAGYLSVNYAW